MSVQPTAAGGTSNHDWWPNRLNLEVLHQHSALSDPMDAEFDYAQAFKQLDLAAVKRDLHALMTIRRTGGRPTSATTAACSSAWPGMARAPTASPTAAAARAAGSSASRR
jgi:hypothetical protein